MLGDMPRIALNHCRAGLLIKTDDLAQLEAGMTLYDAFYRWCRDATDETHTWHGRKAGV